ncbi:replication protein A 70 kDa DNA-binding subunit B, partial [Tanacetum coccineum]
SNQLDCTFWDQWANMWDEYAVKRDELGHVVFILQLGKVKYWDGTPSIHNALFGTKMFINRDLPEILSFRQRLKELPEYDESQFKISLFTPQKPVVTIAEFFNGAVKKMVSSIRECDQKSHCIVYAKKVNVVESKAMSSAGKINDEPAFVKHFKEGFLDEDDDDEGFTTPASQIKVTNLGDDSVYRVLDMQTPTSGNEASGLGESSGSKRVFYRLEMTSIAIEDEEIPTSGNEASGSGESSGSKRVFIDLYDIDSDEDEEVRANKTPKLLTVKVEKEDP